MLVSLTSSFLTVNLKWISLFFPTALTFQMLILSLLPPKNKSNEFCIPFFQLTISKCIMKLIFNFAFFWHKNDSDEGWVFVLSVTCEGKDTQLYSGFGNQQLVKMVWTWWSGDSSMWSSDSSLEYKLRKGNIQEFHQKLWRKVPPIHPKKDKFWMVNSRKGNLKVVWLF